MAKKKDVYVTRDTCVSRVEVYPHAVGIRKFHGCVQYGVAWDGEFASRKLYRKGKGTAELLDSSDCRKRFGFFPRRGQAWLIEYTAKGKMKKTKVDLAFSP